MSDDATREKRRILAEKREQLRILREQHAARASALAARADQVAGRKSASAGAEEGKKEEEEKPKKKMSKKEAAAAARAKKKAAARAKKGATPLSTTPVTVDELVINAVGELDADNNKRSLGRSSQVSLSAHILPNVEEDIPPVIKEQYSREIQTETTLAELEAAEAAAARLAELEAESAAAAEAQAAAASEAEAAAAAAASQKSMSLAAKRDILESETFLSFFTKASSWMNRALNEDYDIMVDYTIDYSANANNTSLADSLTYRGVFASDRWTRHRSITSLDWNPAFPELFLGACNANALDPLEPGGTVLVWSERTEDHPELILLCESAVTTAQFSPFNPQLVVAGSYSGQVVIWDMRVQKRTPVLRTPLSSQGHTHPIYAAKVVGTANAHNLISISTDGRLCSWMLDMLASPQEVLELTNNALKKPVSVTALDFAGKEPNAFVCGAEDGSVYCGSRHGAKQGLEDARPGHFGMVTGIDVHPPNGSVDFSDLFLSSSMDWSARLWSSASPDPIYAFEDAHDYIYDIRWSPTHPALFATGDGGGFLDIWNLNSNSEVPIVKSQLPGPPVSISQLRWSSDGSQIIAGDSLGNIHLWDVGKEIAEPSADEWSRFEHTISQLRRA